MPLDCPCGVLASGRCRVCDGPSCATHIPQCPGCRQWIQASLSRIAALCEQIIDEVVSRTLSRDERPTLLLHEEGAAWRKGQRTGVAPGQTINEPVRVMVDEKLSNWEVSGRPGLGVTLDGGQLVLFKTTRWRTEPRFRSPSIEGEHLVATELVPRAEQARAFEAVGVTPEWMERAVRSLPGPTSRDVRSDHSLIAEAVRCVLGLGVGKP